MNLNDVACQDKPKIIRVLHVDDDTSLLEISKQILDDMGYFDISHANSVDEAFKKLKTQSFDIVISDYEMPQKDGLQFLKELREQKNDIPFILFTGKGREEVVIQALNLGADNYVNKQGSPETVFGELTHHIRSSVERSKAKLQYTNDAMALRSIEEAITCSDANYIITGWNKSAEEMYGLQRHEAIGRRIDDIFKNIHVDPPLDLVLCSVKEKGHFRGEAIFQNKKGEKRIGELDIVSIYSDNQKFKGNVAICHDITERKKTENALRESEEKFRSLAEELPNMIFINQFGKVVYANRKCEEIMGYSKEEFYDPAFNFLSLVDPQSTEILRISFSKHLKGEEVLPYEYYLETKDGKRIDAIITTKLTKYEGQPAILGIITDITQRTKADDELRQSEQRLKFHFENTPLAVIEWDLDFKVTKWNSAATRIFGFTCEEAIGQHANFILPESVKEQVNGVWDLLLAQKGGSRLTNENMTKAGKTITCAWFNTPLIDSAGKTIGVASMVEDITERRKMSDELKRDQSTLESITQSIGAGFVTISKDYRITWANNFIRLYKGDVEGKLCYAVLNTLNEPCHDCGVTKIYAGKTDRDIHEYCSTTIDGKPYWVDIIATPIKDKDGNIVAASELVIDITERKKSEEALLESQQKFSTLFSASPEAAVFVDLDFHVIEANARFIKLFGYSFDEIKGKVINDIIVPEGAKEGSEIIRQKILTGQIETIAPRKRKDGSLVPLLMTGAPVLSGKKSIGFIMVYKDVSDIITTQEELSEALAKAKLLNEKLNVVGGFTRHDIRNKLSAINGYSYILKKKYSDKPDIIDGLTRMEQSVKESMKIFDFARAYEQLGAEQLVDVNVEKTVEVAAGQFSGLPFKVINECAGLTVRADSLLRELIYNLIDNTRKYGQKTTAARVYYQKASQRDLQLIYEDNGVGISSKNKKQLFKQGFSTGGSSGFGLFLSRKTVEVYGWTISEEGEPGKGTKFVITVPQKSYRID
ncbi:MAG TPA: PAS domain S-box protein [Candidatus Nanoarchaeia archaeon]|nr:PAS domain S-box protein [Candidatus Nanoarchaeia archaeon]